MRYLYFELLGSSLKEVEATRKFFPRVIFVRSKPNSNSKPQAEWG